MSKFKAVSKESCEEALIGSSIGLKKQYNKTYCLRQRQFHTSQFFRPVKIVSDADWLVNHNETGQTFESFWKDHVAMGHRPPADRPLRPQTALSFRPKQREKEEANSKLIYLQPIGKFSSGEKVGNNDPFIIWLQTFSSAFFHSAEVRILPGIEVEEIKCDYRVNELTGRFQLNASNILTYFKKNKPRNCRCLIGVTMTDLYPKSSWNFAFSLASLSDGVGVFSLARFQDVFYERWTLGEDSMCRNSDGSLNYSPFKKEGSQNPGEEEVKGILLLRACKLVSHEVCHMFGLTRCFYYECLMNGSNHLGESDRRPPFLCPVCLRKLQATLEFDLVDRYKGMLKWAETTFWKTYLHRDRKLEANVQRKPMWKRRASLPEVAGPQTSLPKTTNRSQSTQIKNWSTSRSGSRGSSVLENSACRPLSSKRIATAASSGKALFRKQIKPNPIIHFKAKTNAEPANKTKPDVNTHLESFSVPTPPLEAFHQYKFWLTEVIKFLES